MPKTVDNLSRMEIGIVENKGPNNMEDQLKIAFKNYSRADLAVAFINTHGIDLIRESILQFLGKTNSHMRVLTRVSKDAFNEPAALKWFLDLTKDHPNFELKASRLLDDFHEKMYIFTKGNSSAIFIGSSNLTKKALVSEGEINLKLTCDTKNAISHQSVESFNEHWEDKADELTDESIDAYTSFYEHVHSGKPDKKGKLLWRKVSKTLKKRISNQKGAKTKVIDRRVWLDYTDGELSDETTEALRKYQSWKNYGYYSSGKTAYHKVERGDVLILADLQKNWLGANSIKSKTQLPRAVMKSDGKYFLAYLKMPKTKRKKITRKLMLSMSKSGIIERARKSGLRSTSAKEMTQERIDELGILLNFRP